MTDEDFDKQVYDLVREGVEMNPNVSLSLMFDTIAEMHDVSKGQVQSAYYRHKKIIDSEAPVEAPKGLEDGTEGDNLSDVMERAERLLDTLFNCYQAMAGIILDIEQLQIKAAGTEKMSRVAKELGL